MLSQSYSSVMPCNEIHIHTEGKEEKGRRLKSCRQLKSQMQRNSEKKSNRKRRSRIHQRKGEIES